MKRKAIKQVLNQQIEQKKSIEKRGAVAKKDKKPLRSRDQLFFLEGRQVHVEKGLLTIYGVPKQIIWFAERPGRDAGIIDIADFLALFAPKRSFAKVPPNAILSAKKLSSGRLEKMVVTLMSATYVKSEEKLSFQIKVVKGSRLLKGYLDTPSLFIDPVTSSADHYTVKIWNQNTAGGEIASLYTYENFSSLIAAQNQYAIWRKNPPAKLYLKKFGLCLGNEGNAVKFTSWTE